MWVRFPPPAPIPRCARSWCRRWNSGTRPSALRASAFGHDSPPPGIFSLHSVLVPKVELRHSAVGPSGLGLRARFPTSEKLSLRLGLGAEGGTQALGRRPFGPRPSGTIPHLRSSPARSWCRRWNSGTRPSAFGPRPSGRSPSMSSRLAGSTGLLTAVQARGSPPSARHRSCASRTASRCPARSTGLDPRDDHLAIPLAQIPSAARYRSYASALMAPSSGEVRSDGGSSGRSTGAGFLRTRRTSSLTRLITDCRR